MKSNSWQLILIIVIPLVYFYACNIGYNQMSELVMDEKSGMNGGFEIVREGLPVNWLLYTPKTVTDADFDLIIDTVDFYEGKQSLKYIIRKCRSEGGWHSPGFCKEFPANEGDKYKISFWVKNIDTRFFAKIGGVSSVSGQYETIVNSTEQISAWEKFEHVFICPQKMEGIRFELNVLKPGTFWIDNIELEKI